jgi:uncharacterized membrane protein
METAYKSILLVHVLCGFTALVTGLIAIFAEKGKPLHNRGGVIYYWAMFGVFVTTIGLFGLKPAETRLQFFLAVAVASFYQTFTGRRALGRKKAGSQPARLDWLALSLVSAFGLFCVGYGVWLGLKGNWFMTALFGFFAQLCLGSAWADYRLFSGKKPAEKGGWLLLHIARMMASYSATVTAFLVNMSGHLPVGTPQWVYLAVWITPGLLIGGIGSRRYMRRYQPKKGTPSRRVAVPTA